MLDRGAGPAKPISCEVGEETGPVELAPRHRSETDRPAAGRSAPSPVRAGARPTSSARGPWRARRPGPWRSSRRTSTGSKPRAATLAGSKHPRGVPPASRTPSAGTRRQRAGVEGHLLDVRLDAELRRRRRSASRARGVAAVHEGGDVVLPADVRAGPAEPAGIIRAAEHQAHQRCTDAPRRARSPPGPSAGVIGLGRGVAAGDAIGVPARAGPGAAACRGCCSRTPTRMPEVVEAPARPRRRAGASG